MKKIRFIIAICILFLVSSCSKDEDSIYTNSVLVEGEFLDLNGGFVGFDPELNEDLTWHRAQNITIFGGDIEYQSLQQGYTGKGFLLVIKLYTPANDFAQGNYIFGTDKSPFTFFEAGYVTEFDVESQDNPPLIPIASGSLSFRREVKDMINFTLSTEDGRNIQGIFEHAMIRL